MKNIYVVVVVATPKDAPLSNWNTIAVLHIPAENWASAIEKAQQEYQDGWAIEMTVHFHKGVALSEGNLKALIEEVKEVAECS